MARALRIELPIVLYYIIGRGAIVAQAYQFAAYMTGKVLADYFAGDGKRCIEEMSIQHALTGSLTYMRRVLKLCASVNEDLITL